ncbi:hypothetical protein EMIHUDRAFT_195068 [Emiliania huxleyi CCMP1516]|uniref:Protein root UVB sensitive/RUS domain-containing protein n=2 Tax=Emiliania huxleyi TaxID=2903 RepID=A0A0D3JGV1_EMIH1|nr:hypothetical protein EMIHUDRAFT_195068 [Emiliania huxleyi CCMP1516]EOD22736.1 hypothetical protein EMIHUDRAFT_195068 [Emiliania huxleyi CCMP1516]|eukprot:XP_005775165.1 hypothetical protein EMIHUDRAFT_195068 [Emiliania huxleyi CCMP1516]
MKRLSRRVTARAASHIAANHGGGGVALWQRAQSALEAVLLPCDFPHSVGPGYLRYVQWTSIGLVTGKVESILATQAALFAVGVGAGAVPMAAAIQWVLKDGVGHAAAIGYATVVNTRFDADARRYRFHATAGHTAADLVACTMPLAPKTVALVGLEVPSFLLLGSLSSAISSVAGVAQAVARARIMASFARQGNPADGTPHLFLESNLADCTRAGQSQAKLMSLVGTAAGIGPSWLSAKTELETHERRANIALPYRSVFGGALRLQPALRDATLVGLLSEARRSGGEAVGRKLA